MALTTVGCGGDDAGTGDGADETAGDGDGDPGDGDGDPTTSGDGDGDPTTSGDGDPSGDGDGDPTTGGTDSDSDGVPDDSDNCPDDPNPNQLDFDGNGEGNVCDVLTFTTVTGTLNSTASASAQLGSCNIPIQIMVTDGEILVQLDDDAQVAAFNIVSLTVADILDKTCQLGVISANVSLKEFSLSHEAGVFPVSVAHNQGAHDAGSIAGDSDTTHPMLTEAIIEAGVGGGAPMPSDLMLDTTLPVFTANISGGGSMGTLSWAAGQAVLATDVFMITDPIPVDINFELKGLVGSLSVAP